MGTEGTRAGMEALAEVSYTAALAAETLLGAVAGRGVGRAEVSTTGLDAVTAMLRDIQNKTHLALLAAHGAEADYQAGGALAAGAPRGLMPGAGRALTAMPARS